MEKYSCIYEGKLRIRSIEMSDTENIVKWRNNERVRNNFLYRELFTVEGHTEWMNTKVASGEVEQFIIGVVGDAENVCDIGSVYFRDIDHAGGCAEYGIFIGEDSAVGHGYGNLTAGWAVQYAREVMGLKYLILRVLADNVSAIKSYENAGFVPYMVHKNYIDGYRDLVLMRCDL